MNYKELFNKMAFLLSSPGRFWEKEAAEGQGSRMMSEYVYPLIGLCGLSEFIGTFIGRDVSSEFFQWALTRCCAIAVSLFGGFFVAVYLLDKISWNLFNKVYSKGNSSSVCGVFYDGSVCARCGKWTDFH